MQPLVLHEGTHLADHFAGRQEDLPFAIAFAANPQRPALEVDVADPQGREFGHAHPGGEEQEDRESDRCRCFTTCGEEAPQFHGGEATRQALGQADPYLGGSER